jgi:hypothetical protein
MKVNHFMVIDDFLENPHGHIEDIFNNEFIDYQSESGIFRNIQVRDDEVKDTMWFIILLGCLHMVR